LIPNFSSEDAEEDFDFDGEEDIDLEEEAESPRRKDRRLRLSRRSVGI
jgi:hypothetical protein